jgi:undecaprenyl diphosphate synthase
MHIMYGPDGTRRYAVDHGISLPEAYEEVRKSTLTVIESAFTTFDVKVLSVWALAIYNLKRSPEQLVPLIKTIVDGLEILCGWAERLEMKINLVGGIDDFFEQYPREYSQLAAMLKNTQNQKRRTLNILVAYDPDKEIQQAVGRCKQQGLPLTFENLDSHWVIPPVDLFVRTGLSDGFFKVSQYVPGLTTARLFSSPILAPDFTPHDLGRIIEDYRSLKDSSSLKP